MKTNLLRSNHLTGTALLLVAGLALPAGFAGPGSGVTIWRNPTAAKATSAGPDVATETPRACTDARVIALKESKWVRGGGRGMVVVNAGKALVCNSCATPAPVTKTHDRNSNGPKAGKPTKVLHDCGKAGCGGAVVANLD